MENELVEKLDFDLLYTKTINVVGRRPLNISEDLCNKTYEYFKPEKKEPVIEVVKNSKICWKIKDNVPIQRTTSVNTTVIGYTIILLLQILFCERANRINGVAFFLGPAGGLLH